MERFVKGKASVLHRTFQVPQEEQTEEYSRVKDKKKTYEIKAEEMWQKEKDEKKTEE